MARIQRILAALSLFFALVSAASAPTFCKCTCFTNSTIIPLGPQHAQPVNGNPPPSSRGVHVDGDVDAVAVASRHGLSLHNVDARASSSSCTQCNRAFCLNYNLPICKGAEEKDVVTMCFQRDSRKDQIIVWCFLLGTAGLLGWKAVQHALHLTEGADARAPLLGGAGHNGGGNGRGNIVQRLLATIGIGGRRGGSGSPLSSPSAAGPRGQYAPLGGSSAD
ncbi:hypothetical protein SPBR_03189 [Sporothrix brasiliensis 5110]|uniref:Uncharacterized protein n=1 Tax=Sporothrix brasiliensis 5110 TaxID=1398154 RepID=A0A0C2J4V7_9PEZI|nr:uncharacterized protein SPBR_03189 [Sporothrix brasiliensis 5110]KIH92102.1 hypothetical protein SPBR_03189 [Sporothrix brasiliensis 5110]